MSVIRIEQMGGLLPRVPDNRLPDGAATVATNCDFGYGELRNMRDSLQIGTLANQAKSIYTDDGLAFFSWTGDVDAVPSPMVNDTFNRVYFSGDGGIKMAARALTSVNGGPPSTAYLAGVPRPSVAPVLSAINGITAATTETRAYVYTFVNIYGEEGPPSAPTKVTTDVTAEVLVTVTKDAVGSYAPIKEVRVYRTPTGSTIADYFYAGNLQVQALPTGTTNFTDATKASALNEPLSSTDFYPPDDALVGLMSLPNGILCAWKGRDLHFCVPYKPWAWPPSYVKSLDSTIVGGIVHGSGAVITTVRSPHLLSGVSPDAMTVSKLNVAQAGVSKWSIGVVDGSVMYASNDGLVMIVGATASLAPSQRFFTRDAWRKKYGTALATMRFSVWDGRLLVFSSTNAFTAFLIRFDEADGSMSELPEFRASCAFISQLSDQCYFVKDDKLHQFAGGLDLAATWQSRELFYPVPRAYGAAQALVQSGSWSIQFKADGQLVHTEPVNEGLTDFRLPSGFKANRWQVRISGTGAMSRLLIGTSFDAFRQA